MLPKLRKFGYVFENAHTFVLHILFFNENLLTFSYFRLKEGVRNQESVKANAFSEVLFKIKMHAFAISL